MEKVFFNNINLVKLCGTFILNVTLCTNVFICVNSEYYIRKANKIQMKLTTSALEKNRSIL